MEQYLPSNVIPLFKELTTHQKKHALRFLRAIDDLNNGIITQKAYEMEINGIMKRLSKESYNRIAGIVKLSNSADNIPEYKKERRKPSAYFIKLS